MIDMPEVTFVTGNQDKINSARAVFQQFPNIHLRTDKIDIPEIQDDKVENVAIFSAEYAAQVLQKPVIKLDSAYHIPALNGFPGPLVKSFQQHIQMEDFLRLMEAKPDRTVVIRECLAYAAPGEETKTFSAEIKATLATQPEGEGGLFDRLVIYDGFDKPQANCDYEEIVKYWNEHLDHYQQFAQYITSEQDQPSDEEELSPAA